MPWHAVRVPLTLVCAVDGSARAHRVADVSRRLAEALGAEVVLARVFDPMTVPVPPTGELEPGSSSQFIEGYARSIAERAVGETAGVLNGLEHTVILVDGEPASEILRLVREHAPRLLVMGSSARTPVDRVFQGSLPGELVPKVSCPVVVVTDRARPDSGGPVLTAFDGSDHSMRAARHAAALAAAMGRGLVLMHVTDHGVPAVEADAALARELHAAAGPNPEQPLDVALAREFGNPVDKLLEASRERDASLIVVGSRGRNAVSAAVLGSVSAGLVRVAEQPVVVAGPASGDPHP